MNTARTMPDAKSMSDFADFPMPGTLLMNGTVMLAAATNVESEMLLVRFWISDYLSEGCGTLDQKRDLTTTSTAVADTACDI